MPRRKWIETSRGKFKYSHNLFPRQVEPLHDFVDGGSGFEIFKHNGNRHTGVPENPGTADLAGDALYGGAL